MPRGGGPAGGSTRAHHQPLGRHWRRFRHTDRGDIDKIDFSVVQTFSFFRADGDMVKRVMSVSSRLFGIDRFEALESPVGVGHAYDLTHILARAIDLAGTTDRVQVRDALEQVRDYRGLVKYFAQPFSADNHDALKVDDVFMSRYRSSDGAIVPLPEGG